MALEEVGCFLVLGSSGGGDGEWMVCCPCSATGEKYDARVLVTFI
jgi:hypothetical protein